MHLIILHGLDGVYFYLLTSEQYKSIDLDKHDPCEAVSKLPEKEVECFFTITDLLDYCKTQGVDIETEDQGVSY